MQYLDDRYTYYDYDEEFEKLYDEFITNIDLELPAKKILNEVLETYLRRAAEYFYMIRNDK